MNILGTLQLGCIYSLLALGIFIAFRIMDTPDLTADGSFGLGLCVAAMGCAAGHPVLGIFAGFAAGCAAGMVTGLLQTKAGIHPILAGILTMTALYSVNLAVMGGSPNVSLLGKEGIFTLLQRRLDFVERQTLRLILLALIATLCIAALTWFFKTGLGLRIRATGNNEKMVRASSINADTMRIIAIAVANGCIALSGAILAQYQGFADINSGTGIVIVGLASVIIGEAFVKGRSIGIKLVSAAMGAVIYRFLIALVLYWNFFPAYMLRFFSALIVALALGMPRIRIMLDASKRKGAAHA
jgi:putative ABC transport system permease protein